MCAELTMDKFFSRRKRKLPTQELIKMFIKYSAEKVRVGGKKMWLVKVNNPALGAVYMRWVSLANWTNSIMKNFPLMKKRQSGMDFLEVEEVGRIFIFD